MKSLEDAVTSRRMTRNFTAEPVPPDVVDELLALAERSPAAGNTIGRSYLVLEGPSVTHYWDVALPMDRRKGFPWPGLLAAPVLVLPLPDPDAYVKRYGEADKARTGLGGGIERWSVPYWDVDTAFAAMVILLGAEARGLGALFFGLFDQQSVVCETFGIPERRRPIGVIALGHPAPDQRSSRSAQRGRHPIGDVVHRGRFRS